MPLTEGRVENAEKKDEISDPLDYKTPDCILPSAPTRMPRGFTITTDGYISLISRVYAATCSKHTDFADNISESAFQYYAVLMLWVRIAEILPSSVKSGSAFFKEITKINAQPGIPIPLHTYLKGIGHFFDLDGSDRQFLLPMIPSDEVIAGVRYTFGKINAKTHFFYEAFPSPAIVVLRMLADIKYTEDLCKKEKNLFWDLPEGLGPDVPESHVESSKPTKNLLGWAPAQTLTAKQLQLFKSCKMEETVQENFSVLGGGMRDLLNKIHHYFRDWDTSVVGDISGAVRLNPLPPMGSLVQGMTIKKHEDFSKFDESVMYCEGMISVSSPYVLNEDLNKGAVISGYRMAKEAIANKHCWSCYDFDEYKSVPESWIRTRNTIYTYGSVARLNETAYTTGPILKKILQNDCIQHTMFKCKTRWSLYM